MIQGRKSEGKRVKRQRKKESHFKGMQYQTGHRFATNIVGFLSCRMFLERLHEVSDFQSSI